MPALMLFLLKVNVALILFCIGYYAILRQLTFYDLNRIYLVMAIVLSSVYPAIDFNSLVASNKQIIKPFQAITVNINLSSYTAGAQSNYVDYWQLIVVTFWMGVTVMALRLVIQLCSLYKLYKRSKPGIVTGQSVRIIQESANPFSFWQNIYINPANHAEADIESIIAHERVHVQQWHTLDILLAELSLIFYWFNPGVWLLKKAISENIEFITDRKVLSMGIDSKAYQYSLLTTSLTTSPNLLVNHFNLSTIKKRIIMMNAKKSSRIKLIRYSAVLFSITVAVLSFSLTRAGVKNLKTLKSTIHKLKRQLPVLYNDVQPAKQVDSIEMKQQYASKVTLSKTDTVRAITKPLIVPIKENSLDSAIYIIDGKPSDSFKGISSNDIESMDVYQGESAKKVAAQTEGMANYDGKKGIVVVKTKLLNTSLSYHQKQEATGLSTANSVTDTIKRSKTVTIEPHLSAAITSGKSVLYIIDGRAANNMNSIKPDMIESITVINDRFTREQYGEKAKNGVIIITTKKQ